ncbi:hypothetical protein WL385_06190 [Staphylococcus epidermidis]
MNDKIKESINEILSLYDMNFKKCLFSISSLLTFEKCNKLRERIAKYPIFTILYEKVKYDENGIKVLINSKVLNDIQTQVSQIPRTTKIYLVDFNNQNISEKIKSELVEKLNKMFNDQKKRKLAHQVINRIEIISLDNPDKTPIGMGYFYLNAKDSDLKFRKIHVQEKTGIHGNKMTEQFELLRYIYDIDIKQFQPYFDKKDVKTKKSNYEFDIEQFESISILIDLLKKYPLPKTESNIKHLESIKKNIFSDNADEYEKYFNEGIDKLKESAFELQKRLYNQYSFQLLMRFQYELAELIKHISMYFKQVNQSNIYEATTLYEKLNNFILRSLLENNSEKVNFKNFLNGVKFEESTINVDEEIIVKKYNDFVDNIEFNKGDFDKLYDQYEVFNSITKLVRLNEDEIKWDHIFVDKYKLKTPFIDKIIIDNLKNINSQYIDSKAMLEREYNKNGNFIFGFLNLAKCKDENELDEEIDELLFNLDNIGNRLLKKVVLGHSKNIKYSNALLKEIRRMIKVLNLYSSQKNQSNMVVTYHQLQKSDNEFDNRINLLTKELVYLRVKKELFNNSKYTHNDDR